MTIQLELKSESGLPDLQSLLTNESKDRYQLLLDTTPAYKHCYFPGGTIAFSLFKASRYCYVNGYFLATVVLGLAYIEKTFYGMFVDIGCEELPDKVFDTLNKKSLDAGIINHETYDIINRTQQSRNKYPPFSTNKARPVNRKLYPHDGFEIHEVDARDLLGIMTKLLNEKH